MLEPGNGILTRREQMIKVFLCQMQVRTATMRSSGEAWGAAIR
jgi:hypothetical protein